MEKTSGAKSLHPGQDLGASEWLQITQEQIHLFAEATLDADPMHVDPEWSRMHSPFRTTLSFGFLTISLLTYFSHQVTDSTQLKYALNYGFDKVRLIAPVPVNSRIRGHFRVAETSPRNDGGTLVKLNVTVELEGSERPALVCDWLYVIYLDS
jgi:acyl dehydratase